MALRKPFFRGQLNERGYGAFPVRQDHVAIAPYEIIVFVAISPITFHDDPESELNTFPVKIDPGFSHNFHIARDHLESANWAHSSHQDFQANGRRVKYTVANGASQWFALYDGDLWLVGSDKRRVHHLRLRQGFTISDQTDPAGRAIPRIPLLGQRALADARLRLEIDYRKKIFSIWTP